MPKISLQNGDIALFKGGAVVCPCNSDLTYKRDNYILKKLADKERESQIYHKVIKALRIHEKKSNKGLLNELSAIGSCEIGNAVITKGYSFPFKHIIFLPYKDNETPGEVIDFILLHQALRAAFTLASLYGVKTLAIPLLHTKEADNDWLSKVFRSVLTSNVSKKSLSEYEVLNIITGVAKEFDKTSLTEITIYK